MFRNNYTVVLLSGGMHSAYALLRAHCRCPSTTKHNLIPLFFEHGQPEMREKLESARAISGSLGYLLQERVLPAMTFQQCIDLNQRDHILLCATLRLFYPARIYSGCNCIFPHLKPFSRAKLIETNWLYAHSFAEEFSVAIKTPCMLRSDRFILREVSKHMPGYTSL